MVERAARRRPVVDAQLLGMVVLALVLAALAFWRGGAPLVRSGFDEGLGQLVRYGVLIAVSFLAAGFAQVLIPREWIQGALGHESGVRGILLASAAGLDTPAGPFGSPH